MVHAINDFELLGNPKKVLWSVTDKYKIPTVLEVWLCHQYHNSIHADWCFKLNNSQFEKQTFYEILAYSYP